MRRAQVWEGAAVWRRRAGVAVQILSTHQQQPNTRPFAGSSPVPAITIHRAAEGETV